MSTKVKTIITVLGLIVLGVPWGVQEAKALTTTNCYGGLGNSFSCYSSGPSYYPTYYPSYTPTYNYGAYYDTLLKAKLLEIQLKYDIAKLDAEKRAEAERQAQKALQERYDRAKLTFTAIFKEVFAKDPTGEDQDYWVDRIVNASMNDAAVRDKMKYYKSLGKTRPDPSTPQVAGAKTIAGDTIVNANVPAVVARLFQQVYGRSITPSESTYWKNRARTDKKTESALKGAMAFHNAKGIKH